MTTLFTLITDSCAQTLQEWERGGWAGEPMHCRYKRINALEQGLALWRPAATKFMAKALFVDDSHLCNASRSSRMTCNRPTMFRSFARSFVVILRYGFRSPNTGAAFTYSLELDVIKIQDLNAGTKRVADDIKNVLRKIGSWHQGPIIGYRNHVPRIEWALDWCRLGR
jgi:hypothetical protein